MMAVVYLCNFQFRTLKILGTCVLLHRVHMGYTETTVHRMILPLYFIHASAVCAGRNGEITTTNSKEWCLCWNLSFERSQWSKEPISANIHNFPKSCDVTCHTADQL